MMKRFLSTAVIASVIFTAHVVEATPITYSFMGFVTADDPLNRPSFVGLQIPISISVIDPGTGGPTYSEFGANFTLIGPALFNGLNEAAVFAQSIAIKVGSSINFNTTALMSSGGFNLSLTGAQNGALATGALPLSLNPGDFTAGVFDVTSDPGGHGFSGFIIGTATAIPEPTSWLIFGAGLVGLAWLGGMTRTR